MTKWPDMAKTARVFGTFLLLALLYSLAEANPILKEKRYSLVRALPATTAQVDLLHELRYKKDGLQIDFWRPADSPGRHVDIWVEEGSASKLLSLLGVNKITNSIRLKDLTTSAQLANVSMDNIDHFDSKYHGLKQIYSELKRLTMGYSEIAKLMNLGKSYENRDLHAIQINKNPGVKKPLFFINCGLHGREWLSISSCMRLIRKILFDEKYDKDVQLITDNFEVIVVPVLNTDGYVYTMTTNRFWRKSRSKTSNADCPGVDLNRNFKFRWGGKGSSADVCDELFSGQKPFSEKETLALARYMYSRRFDMKAFLDVHTFGQLLMHPWGFTKQQSAHSATHVNTLRKVARHIGWATGSSYKYGQASTVLYETSGDSTDWAYGYLGVLHSYGIELRPRLINGGSLSGFKQPATQILPSAIELFITVREIAKQVRLESNVRRTK